MEDRNSLYGLKQTSRQWRAQLNRCLLCLGFVQLLADACVFRLMEVGHAVMSIVVHVDDILPWGRRHSVMSFVRDLNQMVPVKILGELRWYSGCFFERDWEKGVLNISQQTFTDQLAHDHGIEFGKSVMLPVGTKLAKFDKDDTPAIWSFRELLGSLMWPSPQTRPDISNAVIAVARYWVSPKLEHCMAALGILGY